MRHILQHTLPPALVGSRMIKMKLLSKCIAFAGSLIATVFWQGNTVSLNTDWNLLQENNNNNIIQDNVENCFPGSAWLKNTNLFMRKLAPLPPAIEAGEGNKAKRGIGLLPLLPRFLKEYLRSYNQKLFLRRSCSSCEGIVPGLGFKDFLKTGAALLLLAAVLGIEYYLTGIERSNRKTSADLQLETEELREEVDRLSQENEEFRSDNEREDLQAENEPLEEEHVQIEPIYNDVEINFISDESLQRQVQLVNFLGEGANGWTDIVLFNGERCVMKTAKGNKLPLDELQILAHLNGAGGAPKLLATSKKRCVMSMVGDCTLEDLITKSKYGQDFLLKAIKQVCDKIQEMHNKSILHNDIKPDNIIYNKATKEFSLIDFGLSTEIGERLLDIWDPEVFRRLFWMSPETKMYEPLCPKSDVYSVGVMMGSILDMFNWPRRKAIALANRAKSGRVEERPTLQEFMEELEQALRGKESRRRWKEKFGFKNIQKFFRNIRISSPGLMKKMMRKKKKDKTYPRPNPKTPLPSHKKKRNIWGKVRKKLQMPFKKS
ncbi:serine/threonine-protein kinase max-2-like [Macrobrachium nipponense]|uniref:serine/threonine-protein kinase max-2-like n=1 Tax=Macrobrachium nipponense TaxID=159736 RepID=UPI0030C82105